MHETTERNLQEIEKLQLHITDLQELHTKVNFDLENYKKNNTQLQEESIKLQEIINQLHQEKDVLKGALLSPKLTEIISKKYDREDRNEVSKY